MAPLTARRRNLFFSIILVGCVVIIYQFYDLSVSINNKPSIKKYSSYQNQTSVLRLGATENFNLSYVEEHFDFLDQKDPQLIQYTRVHHLTPPSTQTYNLNHGGKIGLSGFSKIIAKLFNYKRNGLFIEAGANDGEGSTSHTLYLEKELGWSGLLVECNPKVVPHLRKIHRKAWIADVCLSPTAHAEMLNFSNPINWTLSATLSKPYNIPTKLTDWEILEVQAIPLYTILAALGWKEVDYFSFDVEGQELAILRNFPFDLFRFKVIIHEENPDITTKKWRIELAALLKKNGYVFLNHTKYDRIYVHEEFYKEIRDEKI